MKNKRNMQKALADYKKLEDAGREPLYYSDLQQLIDITTENGSKPLDPCCLAINALKAGYIIGQRHGERHNLLTTA